MGALARGLAPASYTTTGDTTVEGASPDHKASLIDVGGGASTLVDDLLSKGFSDITVLDIAETALVHSSCG